MISIILIGFVILIFGILTFNRNFVWQNEWTLWSETAKLYPDNIKAHYNLGTVWTDKKEFEKAIKEFEKCLIFNPNATWNPGKKAKANVHYNISLIYKSKGENEKYYIELRKAFELDSDNVDIKNALAAHHNEKGLEYSKKQILAQALLQYKQAIAFNPNLIEAYYNLGLTQYKLKDYENALNSFNECLKVEKNYVNAYICIGNIFYIKGLYNNAMEKYKEALFLDPNSKEAKTNYETLKNLSKFH